MKLLKKLGIGLVVLFIIYLIVCAFMPGNPHIEVSKVIDADKALVFEQLNDFRNHDKWSPWHKMDPNWKVTRFGPETGTGSGFSWTSEKDAGNGSLTMTGSYPNDSISVDMNFMKNGTATSHYYLTSKDNGVEVRWTMDSHMPFLARPFGLMMKKMVNEYFTKGLNSLDSLVQALKNAMPVVKAEPVGIQGIKDLDAIQVLSVKQKAGLHTIAQKLGESYQLIGEDMKANHLEFAGAPGALYYNSDTANFEFEGIIPVTDPSKAVLKHSKLKTIPAGKYLVYNYFGPYDKMMGAYDEMKAYLNEQHLQMNGPSREEYVTDPGTEKDPSKLLSKIYLPVK